MIQKLAVLLAVFMFMFFDVTYNYNFNKLGKKIRKLSILSIDFLKESDTIKKLVYS